MLSINLESPITLNQLSTINTIIGIVNRSTDLTTAYDKISRIQDRVDVLIGRGSDHIWVSDKETGNRILIITKG